MIEALASAHGLPWLLVVALTIAVAWHRLAASRRDRELNGALHELRRPLQALALGADPAPLWPQIARGLALVDEAMNGRPAAGSARRSAASPPPPARRASLAEALESAAGRAGAAVEPGRVVVEGRPAAGPVAIDRAALDAALDNLVANGLEHGAGSVRLEAWREGPAALVRVSNQVGARRVAAPRRRRPDPRRGHGLAIVERIAREASGEASFELSAGHAVATLTLPAVEPPGAAP